MLMLVLIHAASSAARRLPWLLDLATRLSARLLAQALNMPEPVLHSTGLYVVARVQEVEHKAARLTEKSLCPTRLFRRLRSLARRSRS
jgi:hypothetical protein